MINIYRLSKEQLITTTNEETQIVLNYCRAVEIRPLGYRYSTFQLTTSTTKNFIIVNKKKYHYVECTTIKLPRQFKWKNYIEYPNENKIQVIVPNIEE